jgi:prepilin-type processing-associated H-X9-DG protein
VQGYLNPRVAPADLADEKLLANAEYSQLAPYLPRASIYHCPEDRQPGAAERSSGRIRSYAMNAYVRWDGPVQRPLQGGYRIYQKWRDLDKPGPSRLMVFTEVRPDSICWPFFGVTMAEGAGAQFFAFPATHHSDGAQVAFADGHVEYRKWRDRRTTHPGNILYHAHDQPSPGNADLAWLQSVASAKQ